MEITEIIKVFLLAMTPVGELRIAIPFAVFAYQMTLIEAYLISLAGNLFAVFLILILLNPISDFLSQKSSLFCRFFSFIFSRTRKNHSSNIKKYGFFVLVTFVAIPLPITGGWTASLVAFVFGIPFKIAFPLIALGAAIAGIIVSFIVKTGIVMESYFNWQVPLGVILLFIFVFLFFKAKKKKQKNIFFNFKDYKSLFKKEKRR